MGFATALFQAVSIALWLFGIDLRHDVRMTNHHNILLTWELGGGLGHLARLRPLALKLAGAGHSVILALRHSTYNANMPAGLVVVPAPASPKAREAIAEPVSIADILHNEGASDARQLAAQVRAWRGLFDVLRPDVVVMDYSPIALLALQGLEPARITLGTGFASPPAVSPLPNLREWQNHYPDRIQRTEDTLLNALNEQLSKQGQPALNCVGELFERVEATLLATFPELDHYPQRHHGEYVGTWSDLAGQAPEWPAADGPRVFVYLKPFRGLPRLLDQLAARSLPSLVYIGGNLPTKRWRGSSLRFFDQPVDMQAAAQSCDLAILNAGHGSTAAMLMAGKPTLQLPIHIEQYHNAVATERLGAGRMLLLNQGEKLPTTLDALVRDQAAANGARHFAEKHTDHRPDAALQAVADRIVELAEGRRR